MIFRCQNLVSKLHTSRLQNFSMKFSALNEYFEVSFPLEYCVCTAPKFNNLINCKSKFILLIINNLNYILDPNFFPQIIRKCTQNNNALFLPIVDHPVSVTQKNNYYNLICQDINSIKCIPSILCMITLLSLQVFCTCIILLNFNLCVICLIGKVICNNYREMMYI